MKAMGRLQKEQKYLSFPSTVSLSGVFILSPYRIFDPALSIAISAARSSAYATRPEPHLAGIKDS